MSATKSFGSFLFLVVIFSHVLTYNVDAAPMPKSSTKVNATKLSTTHRPSNKPTSRNARFFGKFSFLAGLGLPDAVPLSIKREDLLYERVPTRFSASYNFPPVRWGPYFAAVYEPTPIFLHNPLSYIAAVLNPFNWFGGTDATSRPETTASLLTTNVPVSDQQDGDVVVLLQEPENEISNEDRILFNDKLQTEKEELHADKTKKIASTDNLETTLSDGFTTVDDEDTSIDLIAEETTLKLNREMNQRIGDDGRQSHNERHTKRKKGTHKHTTTTTKHSTTSSQGTTESEDETTETDEPLEPTSTEMMMTESKENSTETLPSNSTNPPFSSTIPNFYPGSYYNGYYYGGQPQNVSHVEFTTQKPDIVSSAAPARLQVFNNGNPYLQQYQPNYDSYDQSFLDYYSRLDQYPTESKDFYGKPLDFLGNGVNTVDQLNGFKPSFPYYH